MARRERAFLAIRARVVGTGLASGDAASVFSGLACGAPGFLSDFMYVTTCHRFCSDSWAQEGMPSPGDPVVTNQKTSPSEADCAGPLARAGTLPLPCP